MSKTSVPPWERKRTAETRQIEDLLRRVFQQVDAYRYNSASIRVRVVDPVFRGKSEEKRDAIVERRLKELPEATQADIMNLLTFSPEELDEKTSFRTWSLNEEFEHPGRSTL